MTAPRKHEIPQIPAEFIITLPQAKGKQFITANGLIYLGHLQGLKRVDVQIVQAPTKDSPSAIVRCEVETDLGTFSDYGEVSPSNKGTVGGTYPLSMATTRARNRALRIATGCPLASYEEVGMEPSESDQDISERGANRQTGEIPATTDTPATEAQYAELNAMGAKLLNEFGKDVSAHITDDLTMARADIVLSKLGVTYRQLAAQAALPPVATATPEASSAGGATQMQIDKIHKLQAALGRPAMVANNITAEEAVSQIAELVRIFNAQAKQPQKAGTR